jgi:hypothetical protein
MKLGLGRKRRTRAFILFLNPEPLGQRSDGKQQERSQNQGHARGSTDSEMKPASHQCQSFQHKSSKIVEDLHAREANNRKGAKASCNISRAEAPAGRRFVYFVALRECVPSRQLQLAMKLIF